MLFVGILLQSSLLAEERQGLLLNAGLSVVSDSNITGSSDEVSDKSAIFSPQIQYLSNINKYQFEFDYQGDFAVYNNNSQYNYNDHGISVSALTDHSVRVNSEFTLGYQKKIEEPGSSNAVFSLNNEFNQITSKSVLAELYYGTSVSSGQFVFGLAHDQRRYSNDEQRFRDMDKTSLSSTFFYRMAPSTRLLFEANMGTNAYTQVTQFSDQSSDDTRYLAGVEWEATAATSGIFKIGYQSKKFDDDRFKNLSGLSYQVGLTWQPNVFSKVTAGAGRTTQESTQQDIAGSNKISYSLSLEHAFTSLTSMNVNYEKYKSDFSSEQNRTDKRNLFEVDIVHSLQSWLYISLDYSHLTRNSNEALFDFSINKVELSIFTNFQ
jgi:hypothetical protein